MKEENLEKKSLETVHEGRVKAFQPNLAERELDLKTHLNTSLGGEHYSTQVFS